MAQTQQVGVATEGNPVPDTMPISGSGARLAVRLCNFTTGQSFLLMSHRDWLDSNLGPAIRAMQGPWVDLIGYASKRGDAGFNMWLSNQRCESAKRWISNYSDRLKFNVQWPKGEGESTGAENNNDGYWRAIEVYLYGFKPPTVRPSTVVGSTRFEIRVVGGASWSPAIKLPIPLPQGDGYIFQIVDVKERKTAFFIYGGVGFAVPNIPMPLPNASMTYAGPPTPFQTSLPVSLPDFEGQAQLAQDPGAGAGSHSVGGTLRLTIDSVKLLSAGARILPKQMLAISGGSGISPPSTGSVSNGKLSMQGGIMPFTGY